MVRKRKSKPKKHNVKLLKQFLNKLKNEMEHNNNAQR